MIKFKKNKIVFREEDLYYPVRKLEIDQRGSFGQRFFVSGLKKIGFKVNNDNDKNKDWDIKFDNNYRVEVKTATLDVNKTFQHESIHKNENYDLLLFLDIAPNQIFVKGFLYKDINFDKLHQRGDGRKRATGSGYKFNFSFKKHLEEGNEVKTLKDLENVFRN